MKEVLIMKIERQKRKRRKMDRGQKEIRPCAWKGERRTEEKEEKKEKKEEEE